jgi:DNA-binding response OmpR family regulator
MHPHTSKKILLVEDDPTLSETLAYTLTKQGYTVKAVDDGEAALKKAREIRPDLIVLDIMLPKLDGMDVCRILRREMSMPILMLTARDSEIDRVLGLEMGADDYLTKPFSMRELTARIKALLRRVNLDRAAVEQEQENAQDRISLANLTLDFLRREIYLDDKILNLKPKEYDLLSFMVRHRGQALSRQLLLDRVWGWDFEGGSRTVDVHMRWLREKIETDPSQPTRIVTVRGIGYRFDG